MPDIVSPEVRSRMMSRIRGENTKPEILIRKKLHALGFRYLINDKRKSGKPDIVLPKYHAIILVHGCFWHGHDCHLFRIPSTRKEFWTTKIERNRYNDQKTVQALTEAGWRVLVVWECSIKGKYRLSIDKVITRIAGWLRTENRYLEIKGHDPDNHL